MLVVGPVIFRNRSSFRRRMLEHLQGYGRDEVEIGMCNHLRLRMAHAARFYRQFDWVAEVTVKDCDSATAEQIAERTVTSALDCLHLIFRAQYSNKMRVGGPSLRTDRSAGVTIEKDGRMHSHSSLSWAGQANFPEGWSDQLDDPHLAHFLSLSGLALEASIDPDLARPVSRRFLDAAQWFGEAARDDRPATRIVKYVTALERMVMTDEMDDIATSVSNRVAALCCAPDASDRQKWRDEVKGIYDLRSQLVHGSMSPNDPKIESGVWLAARIGEETLLGALGALGESGLRSDKATTKQLAKWYRDIVKATDEEEAGTKDNDAIAAASGHVQGQVPDDQ